MAIAINKKTAVQAYALGALLLSLAELAAFANTLVQAAQTVPAGVFAG